MWKASTAQKEENARTGRSRSRKESAPVLDSTATASLTHVCLSVQKHSLTPAYRIQQPYLAPSTPDVNMALSMALPPWHYRCTLHAAASRKGRARGCCTAASRTIRVQGKSTSPHSFRPSKNPLLGTKLPIAPSVFAGKNFLHTLSVFFKIRAGSPHQQSSSGRSLCTLHSASQHLKCLSLPLLIANLSLPRPPATHRPFRPLLHPRHAFGRFFSFSSGRRLLTACFFDRLLPFLLPRPLALLLSLLRFSVLFDLRSCMLCLTVSRQFRCWPLPIPMTTDLGGVFVEVGSVALHLSCAFDSILTCVCPLAAARRHEPTRQSAPFPHRNQHLRWPLLDPHPSSLITPPNRSCQQAKVEPLSTLSSLISRLACPALVLVLFMDIALFRSKWSRPSRPVFFWSRLFQLKHAAWQKMEHQCTSPRSPPCPLPSILISMLSLFYLFVPRAKIPLNQA